ncbi:hypothetical protein N836_18090 [Leptolyngbya sp. Heron Island J]|uniref:hypothetical protein n=1 Tax=Leptolyngbya sp. Heron Island J TaxID=1385935 RepID=UPI0003B97B65|nr:hypothetical protein [Leptolyngbya sp. Heron Island J]ESA34159.1 hypothetical protein N836_18090 [Leptolyngbya sp. Heron Island J]
MQGFGKVKETINRGITAVAMTAAIATIYAATATDGQTTTGDVLRNQIQALLKLHQADGKITQEIQKPQESLATLLLSSRSNTYSHQ